MKYIYFILIFSICASNIRGQVSLNDGMYDSKWTAERDAIAFGKQRYDVDNRRKWMNGDYFGLFSNPKKQNNTSSNSDVIIHQYSGIKIERDSPTNSSQKKRNTRTQQEIIKKHNRDIERKLFYERRRAEREDAARRAAEREKQRQSEEIRRREHIRKTVAANTYVALERETRQKQNDAYYRTHEGAYELAKKHSPYNLTYLTEENNFGKSDDYVGPRRNFSHSLRKKTQKDINNDGKSMDDLWNVIEKRKLQEYAKRKELTKDENSFKEWWEEMKSTFGTVISEVKKFDSYMDPNDEEWWDSKDMDNEAGESIFKGTAKYLYTNAKGMITEKKDKIINTWNYCKNFRESVSAEDIMNLSMKPVGSMLEEYVSTVEDMDDIKKSDISILKTVFSPQAPKQIVNNISNAHSSSEAWKYSQKTLEVSKIETIRLTENVSKNHGYNVKNISSQLINFSSKSKKDAAKEISKVNAQHILNQIKQSISFKKKKNDKKN